MTALRFQTLLYDVEARVATITLNRPDKLNAATPEMARELIDAFDASDGDDNVRAVIVTGAGKAFCAGADLTMAVTGNAAGSDKEVVPDWGGRVALRIFRCLKPVIAAFNGPAVGIGATVPLSMDIRLASTDAKFAFPFVRLGIVPESASSWFLPRIVGIATAMEWCLSGRSISADEAQHKGLVHTVHQPAELMDAARTMARDIADNAAPVSAALTRQLLWRMLCADDPMEVHRLESAALHSRRTSSDAREGIVSFLEKRSAGFSDLVSRDMPDIFGES